MSQDIRLGEITQLYREFHLELSNDANPKNLIRWNAGKLFMKTNKPIFLEKSSFAKLNYCSPFNF